MQINRGLLFWGLALVTGGVVALAVQLGYVERSVLIESWRLWPVVLIALGLAIILSRTPFAWLGTVAAALVVGVVGGSLISIGPGSFTCGGDEPTVLDESSGPFSGTSASISLEFNCGSLAVDLTDGDGWEARTGATGDEPPRLDADADSLALRSPDAPFGWGAGRQRWELTLGTNPVYDLSVSPNAATTTLDLAGGRFTELDLSPNAGTVALHLEGAQVDDLGVSLNAGTLSMAIDAGTAASGEVSSNAGSIKLCAADGTALSLELGGNVLFSHNLDDSGLDRAGNTWTTEAYGTGARRVELRIEGNAASFELNPKEGCA